MKAVILISHGSRSAQTKQEVFELIEKLKLLLNISYVECAFLEMENPSIPDAIAAAVTNGAREIVILLNFLNAGRHVDFDIPQIVNEAQKKFPQVSMYITKPLGQHKAIPSLFADMLLPFINSSNESKI